MHASSSTEPRSSTDASPHAGGKGCGWQRVPGGRGSLRRAAGTSRRWQKHSAGEESEGKTAMGIQKSHLEHTELTTGSPGAARGQSSPQGRDQAPCSMPWCS